MTNKWRISGLDAFSYEEYSLDGEWDTEAEAQEAAYARLDYLEKVQPNASSGGQGGVQDRVYVERPNGTRYRVTGRPAR